MATNSESCLLSPTRANWSTCHSPDPPENQSVEYAAAARAAQKKLLPTWATNTTAFCPKHPLHSDLKACFTIRIWSAGLKVIRETKVAWLWASVILVKATRLIQPNTGTDSIQIWTVRRGLSFIWCYGISHLGLPHNLEDLLSEKFFSDPGCLERCLRDVNTRSSSMKSIQLEFNRAIHVEWRNISAFNCPKWQPWCNPQLFHCRSQSLPLNTVF